MTSYLTIAILCNWKYKNLKKDKNMHEEKIFFKTRISFQRVLSFLSSELSECEKNEKLDDKVIATWNANICSCSHRCELSSYIDVPFGVRTDDSTLILGMFDIKKYGKISLIVNQPYKFDTISYKIPYDTTVLGVVFENDSLQEKENSVVMAMRDALHRQLMTA